MGIQTTVWSNDTVAVEVMVCGRITSVVTSESKDLFTRNTALVAQALIHEVPDIAALILGVLSDDVPILLKTTHRVTHGMGILTLDQWTGIIGL